MKSRTADSSRRRLLLAGALGALATSLAGCIEINEAPTYVRVVNASADHSALDVYLDDRLRMQDVATGSASEYLKIDEGRYDVEFTRAGQSSVLAARRDSLDADDHTTYVAHGTTGSFAVLRVDENMSEPDAGSARLQVAHAATGAGKVDVYLTAPGVALADATPGYAGVEPATTVSAVRLDAGTYRLRVTAAGSKTDVRLDLAALELASRSRGTLLLMDTRGGLLVDSALLAQGGGMTLLRNGAARLRAAVGVADAASATVRVGSATVVSGAPYLTLSAYQRVPAGPETIEYSIGGTPVATLNATLDPGGEYTFVLLGTAAAPAAVLLVDDNRAPPSGEARLRLVNAMSGLGAPISAAVDFSPVVENVAVGAAGVSTGFAGATDARIDVSRTTTATPLHTQSGATLPVGSVHTLVMFGGEGTAQGVLRKDR